MKYQISVWLQELTTRSQGTPSALQSHNHNSVKSLDLRPVCEMLQHLPLILAEWQGPTAPQRQVRQPVTRTKARSEIWWSKLRLNLNLFQVKSLPRFRACKTLIINPPTHLNLASLHGVLWSMPTFTGCSLHSQRKNNKRQKLCCFMCEKMLWLPSFIWSMSQSNEGEFQVTLTGNIYRIDFFLLRKIRAHITRLINFYQSQKKLQNSFSLTKWISYDQI